MQAHDAQDELTHMSTQAHIPRRTRSGRYVVSGRTYRTRVLALASLDRYQCRSQVGWYGGTAHRCAAAESHTDAHGGEGLGWVDDGDFPLPPAPKRLLRKDVR